MAYEALKNETNLEMQQRFEKKYKKMNILEKTNKGKKEDWVFYDGPIYANARPGLHHVFAKTIKDFKSLSTATGNIRDYLYTMEYVFENFKTPLCNFPKYYKKITKLFY